MTSAGEMVAFGAIALVMLLAGFASAVAKRTFHSVMFLGVVLVAAAGYYILLGSPLVGVIQVLVYVGGILTLFVFAVMFVAGDETEESPIGRAANAARAGMGQGLRVLIGALAALALFGVMALAIKDTPAFATQAAPTTDANDITAVVDTLFGPLVVPFEVLGILLTAVMFGALVIARPLTVKGTEESSISHPNVATEPQAATSPAAAAEVHAPGAPAAHHPEGSA